jgi:hypothetical protein
MEKSEAKINVSVLVALGAVWGLAEAGVGMYLRGTCAATYTGSLMTGGAIFFLAAGLSYSRRLYSPVLLLVVASAFKLFDAYLLRLPVLHGAVANPMFAFVTEVAALLLLFKIIDSRLLAKPHGRMMLGGLAALVAVNLFPLVKYVTGIPACVYPGTNYPLSLYYAPIAIAISAATCPLGMAAGETLARVLSCKPARSVGAQHAVPLHARPILVAAVAQAIVALSAVAIVLLHR